ncbi:MAG: ATPase, T2SS/T4P/T4SS family, partial [Tumebacillaceae bacterium]
MNLNELLRTAHERGASDLHLTVGAPPTIRLHGALVPLEMDRLTPQDTNEMARELLAGDAYQVLAEQGEYDFSWEIEGVCRFRIHAYRQRGTLSLAARIVPTRIPSPEELGLPDSLLEFVHRPQGLFLVTGPTGSGKSTTLACLIDQINKRMNKHIITLEDPI